jgi:uncharacterized protein
LLSIAERIAGELSADTSQVQAAIRLLDEGATVPFVARYRKEATGGLVDSQLRDLQERLGYLRELEERRQTVLDSIREQGKLTPGLEQAVRAADTKTRLEDLYLPYRPKRRTKAQIAREAGLEPLAEEVLAEPGHVPEALAARFVDAGKGVPDVKAALEGARHILMERFAEDAELNGRLRDYLWEHAELRSCVVEGKAGEGAKFADYFEYRESISRIPSHRALALFRGRNEGILSLELVLPESGEGAPVPEAMVARQFGVSDRGRPADGWLWDAVRRAWRIKIFTRLDLELKGRLKAAADEQAIRVFAQNLHDLLLAAPAGPRTVMGLDPGLRTGVKVAVVDATGKVLDTATIYPHAPRRRWDESVAALADLTRRHRVELVSIGNGTASRETDRLVGELAGRHPDLGLQKLVVNEAGASVYSASALAGEELPALDVTLRGAVSIARRLQDPLAELVKIEPKSIGVGQYQHDVAQSALARSLDNVVEDCVNAVGVDVNTASAPLLARVSGLSPTLADGMVRYRDQHGAFRRRRDLKQVPRLGDKTFEQAAGFLRIMGGDDPLDASAVHPEAYPVVERILADTGRTVKELIGDAPFLRSLAPARFVDERFGLPTVLDILSELEKPGRDPRPEFKTAAFREGVEALTDLEPGMVLEGVVTNVTNFGAFVDIGVHQDGLVHISAMSDRYVKDPRDVVRAGQVVRVKVLSVDLERRRVGLSMRSADANGHGRVPPPREKVSRPVKRKGRGAPAEQPAGAMAAAFARARRDR